jgi:hypothetical protein
MGKWDCPPDFPGWVVFPMLSYQFELRELVRVVYGIGLRFLAPFFLSLLVMSMPHAARAADVSALVEGAEKTTTSLSVIQFLKVGAIVDVGPGGEIVLSYLRSCIREEISGGQVTIGERQSSISGGLVVREKVNCDSDQYVLTQSQTNESGATAFRANPDGDPVVTVYGTNPLFVFDETPVSMEIERRDIRGRSVTLQPDKALFDLADFSLSLVPGGTYRVTAAGRSLTVLVDHSARASHVFAVGRLVRF